ncbi:MAG TPA: TIR domain-containing protein [Actinomycetes bacterium]|nr:TIR domain-containing protein [Actinomycetes bacterium]
MMRELFAVLYDGTAWRTGRYQTTTGETLRAVVGANAAVYNFQRAESGSHMSTDADEYDMFSWHLQRLPGAARVAQVPRPGVLLAVHRDAPSRIGDAEAGTMAVALQLRRELERDEEVSARFFDFMDTPAARWPAVPLTERDLLVSHDAADAAVVGQLVEQLGAASLTCLAVERPVLTISTEGDDWRRGLATSAVLVSVIGPSSVDEPALHREAGAAWALGRAIVPALVGVAPERLHYLLSRYQVRQIDTAQARTALASELAEFMTGAAGGMAD